MSVVASPSTPGTPTVAPVGRSLFDNGRREVQRRLRLLEQSLDPGTIRRLTALGVAPGWRCLEVGAGAGSITRWLSGRVGDLGSVVAVDLDPRFVEDDAPSNVEVHRRDIVTEGVPGGSYDLIHVRMVLMQLPERERVLSAVTAALRPGGWLLVEEADCSAFATAESALYVAAWRRALEALATVGFDTVWARQLPRLLDRVGLEDVRAEGETLYFRGGSAVAEFFRMTWAQVRPIIVGTDGDAALIDAAEAELGDPTRWFPSATLVGAWGRRPG
jgi:SAM-dependent methyltransferase